MSQIPSDLRSTIALLEKIPGQLIHIKKEVDPYLEMVSVCRKIGVGNPMTPPAKIGPAVLFEKVKDYSMPVVSGIFGSRERVARLLGSSSKDVSFKLLDALKKPVPPVLVKDAPCQEVVIDKDINIMGTLPIPTPTSDSSGPYINLGLARGGSLSTGADVTFHRMCVINADTTTFLAGGEKHIARMHRAAEANGKPLPISISIGLDPATVIATSFHPPMGGGGLDELAVAGGLRGSPVEVVKCKTVEAEALANAEIVLEGELLPKLRMSEDASTKTGQSYPDMAGYLGPPATTLVFKVKAITHRRNPIYHMIVTPGEEHTSIAGIPTEASILKNTQDGPGKLRNVYLPSAGGGKLVAFVQVAKESAADEGYARQIGLAVLYTHVEIKHVILVDEDIDIFDYGDVLWAMTTRFQANSSLIPIPGIACHPAPPDTSPEYSPLIQFRGVACKAIFDCTTPYHMKKDFARPKFLDVDINKYLE